MYRQKHLDIRTHEEKILEECTFQPKINGPSPFISERSLRKYAEKLRKPPPPPSNGGMISPIRKSPKLKNKNNGSSSAPLGGMYTKANGLVRGPPQIIGIPMFYFDPFNPPNFQEGTYGAPMKTVTIEEVEPEIEKEPETKKMPQLQSPPLPPFLDPNYKKEAPSPTKKLVIVKGVKKEVKEEVSGWQAVLAEMEAKKNKGMKKVVKPEVKAEAPKAQPKGKKSGKDFKDVMEELNYKLAVLRGDIVEDKEDGPAVDSSTNTPPPTPIPFDADSKGETPGGKKGGRPDIAAMLAKAKAKAPSAGADEKPSSTESVAKKEAKEEVKSVIAVPMPDNLPFPPPIPVEWPPKPYVAPEKKNTERMKPADASKQPEAALEFKKEPKIVKKEIIVHEPPKVLPEGYYLAATKAGMVAPFEILEVGLTTQASLVELREQFDEEDREQSGTEDDYFEGLSPTSPDGFRSYQREDADEAIAGKLSANDLPVPGSFVAAVKRLQKAVEMREERLKFEKDLEFRNYDPPPQQPPISSPKKLKPTVPQEFNFHTQNHFETKRRTFRKHSGRSEEDKLPLSDRLEENLVHQSVHKFGKVDRPTAYWLQSLRADGDVRDSNDNTTPKSKELGRMQALPTQTVLTTFPNPAYQQYNISEEYYRKAMKSPYTTESKAPKFLSHDVLERRQQERQSRKQQEQLSEQFNHHLQRSKKEVLKEKALTAAKEAGAYKPHNRFRLHQRMIERYNNKPEIGLNLEHVTQKAFEQYYLSSSGTSHASETSNYSDLPWENLREGPFFNQGNSLGSSNLSHQNVYPPTKTYTNQGGLNRNSKLGNSQFPMNLDELLEEYG